MTTEIVPGQRTWSMVRDSEGNRTYKLKYLIRADKEDGPGNVLRTPGLPVVGSWWVVDNDVDLWAWCRPDTTVTPLVENEPNTLWEIEFTFSTKPPEPSVGRRGDGTDGGGGSGGGSSGGGSNASCSDSEIEDPLLQPQKVSGSFVKYTKEVAKDREGNEILNSAFEPIKGPQVEFDDARQSVRIEQNVLFLRLDLLTEMINTVNEDEMWNLPARCIKLSSVSWEKKFYGSCYLYYTRVLEFDIRADTFDVTLPDLGSKALNGKWNRKKQWELIHIPLTDARDGPTRPPDPENPADFIQLEDANGNLLKEVLLNGFGIPHDPNGTIAGTALKGSRTVEYYGESNFFLLGVPLILGI